jgi:hypothetical protein
MEPWGAPMVEAIGSAKCLDEEGSDNDVRRPDSDHLVGGPPGRLMF